MVDNIQNGMSRIAIIPEKQHLAAIHDQHVSVLWNFHVSLSIASGLL